MNLSKIKKPKIYEIFFRKIIVWSLESGEKMRTLDAHTENIYEVCYNADGKKIASASLDMYYKIYFYVRKNFNLIFIKSQIKTKWYIKLFDKIQLININNYIKNN